MGKTQSRERVIREFTRGQFNDAKFWENYPISVPPVVASELRFCRIIDVDYRIVVSFSHQRLFLKKGSGEIWFNLNFSVYGGSWAVFFQFEHFSYYPYWKRSIS